jgi:hypothetical protein
VVPPTLVEQASGISVEFLPAVERSDPAFGDGAKSAGEEVEKEDEAVVVGDETRESVRLPAAEKPAAEPATEPAVAAEPAAAEPTIADQTPAEVAAAAAERVAEAAAAE